MSWYITIAILAYLGFAINSVIDKFLLKKAIPEPATYAFYIGILSLAAIALAPFGYMTPALPDIAIAILSGTCFTFALIAFFASLQRNDASIVLPFIGGIAPLVTLAISWNLASEHLSARSYTGTLLLILGSFIIGWAGARGHGKSGWISYALLSAFLFAVSFTLAKDVYLNLDGNFVSGLIWTRVGSAVGSLLILLHPESRKKILHTTRGLKPQSGGLFFSGQLIAATSGIAQNYALSLGSVTLVNALQGTQFVFLFLITSWLSRKFPAILQEDFSQGTVVKKIVATVLIGLGLLALV